MNEKNEAVNQIDLRGLACPEPVLRTKKILDQKSNKVITLLVDTDVTVHNLDRLSNANNAKLIESQKLGDHYRVLIAPTDLDTQKDAKEQTKTSSTKTDPTKVGPIVFISKDSFGAGHNEADHAFSNKLLNLFLQSLLATGHCVDAILMANSGVKIMADPAFTEVLTQFEQNGTKVFACGLCVDYYKIKDSVPSEKITNMFAICEYLMTAERVIEP